MAQDIINDIIGDLKEYSRNVCKNSAIYAREELYKTAQSAIEYFYNTYTPGDYYKRNMNFLHSEDDYEWKDSESDFVYSRTYNLRKSYKKWYKNNHDSTYSGGVILSPEYMDDVYRADKELIFNLAYSGYHGLNTWTSSARPASPFYVTQPSPLEMIEDKANQLFKRPDKMIQFGVTQARLDGRYKYI